MDRVAERKDRDSGPALPPGLSGLGLGLGSNGKPLADVATKLGEDMASPRTYHCNAIPVFRVTSELTVFP